MFFKKLKKHIRDYWALHLMALPGVGQKTAGVVLMVIIVILGRMGL